MSGNLTSDISDQIVNLLYNRATNLSKRFYCMSEFLFSYGLFFAKVVTGLIALIFVMAIIAGSRGKKEETSKLRITHLNRKIQDLKNSVLESVLDKKALKKRLKEQEKEDKQKSKKGAADATKPKLYVLEFDGDIQASEVATMRDEITAVLSVAEPQDEVLLKLENGGGAVHGHGLAASQLQRIRDAKLSLTVSVDMVAASGGYMMACVADKIIAAPFAIIGSIGVIAQLPNFNRLLDKAGIDFEQHTAGEFKRTLTMFGKNGEKERTKLKEDLQDIHELFRDFVVEHRSRLDIDKVATGEHWFGKQALELKLVDELITSDEFLMRALNDFEIYEMKMEVQKSIKEKLFGGFLSGIDALKESMGKAHRDSNFR